MVSLYEARSEEVGEYATLSYCWGLLSVPLKTTMANIRDHYDGIPID